MKSSSAEDEACEGASEASPRRAGDPHRSEIMVIGLAKLIIGLRYFHGCGGWVKTGLEGSLNRPKRGESEGRPGMAARMERQRVTCRHPDNADK